jgi:hypothetical protein
MPAPPDRLIHIGFPKAASTSLQAWFSAHPQLLYATNSLGGYYHAHEIARAPALGSGPQPRCAVISSELFSTPFRDDAGELPGDTPIELRRQAVAERLRLLFGDALILIVTRGFRAVLMSAVSHRARLGLPASFDDVEGPERIFDYDSTIALYSDVFGADNLIVLPVELLRDDPARFIEHIETPLGIDPGGLPPRLNESLSPAELYWYPRLSSLARRVGLFERYRRRVGGRTVGAVAGALHRVAPSRVSAPNIPEELVERYRGRASTLADHPLYLDYAADYLNDGPRLSASS